MFKLFLADSWQINVYPLHLIDLSISNVCIYICTHTLTHTHTLIHSLALFFQSADLHNVSMYSASCWSTPWCTSTPGLESTTYQRSEWSIGEMLSGEISEREGQEFGSLWEKSRRHCTACLLSWAADGSEMFRAKVCCGQSKEDEGKKKRSLCLPEGVSSENWVIEWRGK